MQAGLIWGLALSLHLTINIENMYLIYVIAAVVQLLFILWYFLRRMPVLSVKIKDGKLSIKRPEKAQKSEDDNEQNVE